MTNLAELAVETREEWESKCSPEEVKSLLGSLTPMERGGRSEIIEMTYPRLDLSFLRQRQTSGFPKFAVFHLSSPWCEFVGEARGNMFGGWINNNIWNFANNLSEKYFSDVLEFLSIESTRRHKEKGFWYGVSHGKPILSIKQKFGGLMPGRVREDIRVADEAWDGHVVIIADAGEWKINEIERSKADPLVVKFEGSSAFLISAFDVSKAEDLVAREFSTGEVSEIINK